MDRLEADELHQALGAAIDEERVRHLVQRLDRAMRGHNQGEVLLALCFALFSLLQDLETMDRPGALAAIMRMIDPSTGHG